MGVSMKWWPPAMMTEYWRPPASYRQGDALRIEVRQDQLCIVHPLCLDGLKTAATSPL